MPSRRLARKVAHLLQDGRPRGCTCFPSPMLGALPCDNRHTGMPRCPYTAIERGTAPTPDVLPADPSPAWLSEAVRQGKPVTICGVRYVPEKTP